MSDKQNLTVVVAIALYQQIQIDW